MKKLICAALALLCIASLFACSRKEKYRNDVATSVVASRVAEELNGETDLPLKYVADDTGFLADYFKSPDYVTDRTVLYAASTNNINEIGVFLVKDGHAKDLAALLKTDYLKASLDKNRDWYDSYIPMETPKLRDAEVRVFGNYVIYAILDADGRETAFEAVEDVLEK